MSAPTDAQSAPSPYAASPYAQYPGGAQYPAGAYPPPNMMPLKTSGKAITSMVLGIIGLIPYVGWILGPAAIIFAVMARKDIRNNPQMIGGGGFAMAGLILGIVDVAFVVITILLAAIVFTLVSDIGPSPTP